MSQLSNQNVTQILAALHNGDSNAAERLLSVVYGELHGIAKRVFASQHAAEKTIQPTILVHDVFMKLAEKTDINWKSRCHFFAVAAKATRDLLVDHARKQYAAKRGGGWKQLPLSGIAEQSASASLIDVGDLEDALKRLGEFSPRQEQIVEMRFFAGLTVEEVDEVLAISPRTVLYDWRMARAWLRTQLGDEE